jgi:predicted DNA-binding transcriptional regulator AlpA
MATPIVQQIIEERIERFIREPERENITGLSKASWWRLETAGRAPSRIRIDARTVAWRLSDLQAWIELIAAGEQWQDDSTKKRPGPQNPGRRISHRRGGNDATAS